MFLEIMLFKLKECGYCVFIFSQFFDQLMVFEDFLMSLNFRYECLDGSQFSLEKQKKIDVYNVLDLDIFCMLLLMCVGGVGINLVMVDIVIIFDFDWNFY